jgi:hypothetical protein
MLIFGIFLLIISYFIAIGYFIAPLSYNPHTSTPMFWFGFLFILRSKQLANTENYWREGAMLGMCGHILLFALIIIFWTGRQGFAWYLSYVYRPITYIAATFFQHQYIQNPAGSNTDITTLIRAVTYNFLNICTYISIGAIIGKLFIKQKSS